MKVCQKCGVEIGGKDGVDNLCWDCEYESEFKPRKRRRRRQELTKKERETVYRSCGLVKVKGALGGEYWE